MKLEFGKYTEVTTLAKKVNPSMFDIYEKVYICPDTHNWWLSVIQKDINADYEHCEGSWLIERDRIEYERDRLNPMFLKESVVKTVLEDWGGECWDNLQTCSLEEAIENIDGGFGIIAESE